MIPIRAGSGGGGGETGSDRKLEEAGDGGLTKKSRSTIT